MLYLALPLSEEVCLNTGSVRLLFHHHSDCKQERGEIIRCTWFVPLFREIRSSTRGVTHVVQRTKRKGCIRRYTPSLTDRYLPLSALVPLGKSLLLEARKDSGNKFHQSAEHLLIKQSDNDDQDH